MLKGNSFCSFNLETQIKLKLNINFKKNNNNLSKLKKKYLLTSEKCSNNLIN